MHTILQSISLYRCHLILLLADGFTLAGDVVRREPFRILNCPHVECVARCRDNVIVGHRNKQRLNVKIFAAEKSAGGVVQQQTPLLDIGNVGDYYVASAQSLITSCNYAISTQDENV